MQKYFTNHFMNYKNLFKHLFKYLLLCLFLCVYGNMMAQKETTDTLLQATKNQKAKDKKIRVAKVKIADTLYATKKITKKLLFIKYKKRTKEIDSTALYLKKHFLWIPYRKYIDKPIPKLSKTDSLKAKQEKIARLKELILQDSLKKQVMRDTLNYAFYKLDAIRIGIDGSYFLKGVFSKSMATYFGNNLMGEITADASFKDNRYFLVADVGYSTTALLKPNSSLGKRQNGFQYEVQGAYFRVGLDYNVMRRYFNNEVLFVGVRYGQSFFNHELRYNLLPDSVWNINLPDSITPIGKMEQSGLTANWVELTGGLKVNIWKNIFVGYTIRLMFLGNISGGDKIITRNFDLATGFDGRNNIDNNKIINYYKGTATMTANEIPGYGNTEESFKLGFSFYASYRFPLRKRPEVVLD